MNFPITLSIYLQRTGVPFSYFYLAAIITGMLFLFFSGIRRKYPVPYYSTILALILVFFITGLKLFPYKPQDWLTIFAGDSIVPDHVIYLPGGILFGFIAVLIAKYLFRFRAPLFEGFVPVVILLLIIQRTGCYLSGCCFGTVSDLPWAVNYPAGTTAYLDHLHTGLIDESAAYSLPVHPTQLYEVAGAIIILLIYYLTRNSFKIKANHALSACFMLVLMRFIIEFLREPVFSRWYCETFLFMNVLQWMLLVLMIILGIYIFYKERYGDLQKTRQLQPLTENYGRNFIVLSFLVILVWNCREIFSFIEICIVLSLLSAAFIANITGLFRHWTVPAYRSILMLVLISAFITMSQDSTRVVNQSDTTSNHGWFSVEGSFGGGAYTMVSRDCNGNITDEWTRNYEVLNVGGAYHYKPKPNHHLVTGIHWVYYADHTSRQYETDYRSYGLNPFLSYDTRYLGGGIGMNILFENSMVNKILPTIYVRGGPQDIIYGDFRFMNDFYFSGMSGYFQAGIGSGFGQVDKSTVRLGAYVPSTMEKGGFFIAGDFLIARDVTIKTNISISSNLSGSIGLQWHIGKYRWKPARNL